MRCYLSLVAVACLASAGRAAVSFSSNDRVIVVGANVRDAVSAASAPPTFSPAGLAQLAMDALGLPTGSLVRLSSDVAASISQLVVQSPAQADAFNPLKAYAMVFVDGADAAVLDALDQDATGGYHKIFDLTTDSAAGSSTKIPAVIARSLTQSVGASVHCAGSAEVCAKDVLPAEVASSSHMDAVYSKYTFLTRKESADAALAEQLAQTQQLAARIAEGEAASSAFVAVDFASVSSLSANKQLAARNAIALEVKVLLSALQAKYPSSCGAQIVATSASVDTSAAITAHDSSPRIISPIMSYGRMLLSFNEKIGSSDEDDSDDDDDSAANATVSGVDIDDIAEYQIILWTAVILVTALLLVLIAMCNMDNKRDSLLYAKFTTSNANRKFD